MALFTDGTAVTSEDLTQHDSSLLEVCAVESVNLSAKLALAHDEVGLEIETLFERSRTNNGYFGSCGYFGLANLVVSTPIRLWHTYHTLALVYRDVYFNQLNDRYQARWKEYVSLGRWAKEKLIETGVGLVSDPIAQAAEPSVSSLPASENGGTFYFSCSYLNAAGEEGKASSPIVVTTLDGSIADIQVATAPANATAWNLYGGTNPSSLYLQNGSPLDIGTDSAFYPSMANTSGRVPGDGQVANFYKALPRLLQRG